MMNVAKILMNSFESKEQIVELEHINKLALKVVADIEIMPLRQEKQVKIDIISNIGKNDFYYVQMDIENKSNEMYFTIDATRLSMDEFLDKFNELKQKNEYYIISN